MVRDRSGKLNGVGLASAIEPVVSMEGKHVGFAGKSHTKETKLKISEKSRQMWRDPKVRKRLLAARRARRGYRHSQEARRKMSRALTGRKFSKEHVENWKRAYNSGGYKPTLETRKKIGEASRRLWRTKNYRDKVVSNTLRSLHQRPTSLEKKMIDFIQKHSLSYLYCGNGSLVIGGKCPDFFNVDGKKVVIEVSSKTNKRMYGIEPQIYEKERINHFRKYGFKTLVIWAEELDNESSLSEKIKDFEGAV